eukprot:GEMP01020286.1.p1 GENE.GEMP01020286.1~~GEMP01020286.1.p1  ORF type:complete len:428 (+),score=107.41 GEMP01020286.1:45-1328(+)
MDLQREQLLRQAADIGGTYADVGSLLANRPPWKDVSSACASFFNKLGDCPLEQLQVFKTNVQEARIRVAECLGSTSLPCVSYLLLLFYEGLRVDSSLYDVLVGVQDIYATLQRFLTRNKLDTADADRVAYVLSGVMSHSATKAFTADEARTVASLVDQKIVSPVGSLAAIANLLKGNEFREILWADAGVVDQVFRVKDNAPAPLLYKSLLCVWLWSFNEKVVSELHQRDLVQKLNAVLSSSRVEKIVRIGLQILKNTLVDPQICEDVAEKGSLEIVNQLEYEKWRDSELYEDIKSCSSKIAQEISVLSNFERYERELLTGKLSWGFIHTERFWGENVTKFEKDDFRAIKSLCGLISQKASSTETLAVTCHDLGEFARLHPIGKRICDRFAVKGRVLELMLDKDREVAREALLCVQKLMLQKHVALEA